MLDDMEGDLLSVEVTMTARSCRKSIHLVVEDSGEVGDASPYDVLNGVVFVFSC